MSGLVITNRKPALMSVIATKACPNCLYVLKELGEKFSILLPPASFLANISIIIEIL